MKRKDEDYIRNIIFEQKYESQKGLASVYDVIWRRFYHGDMWTGDDVARMLADMLGCACDIDGNDEWLPDVCENSDTCIGESEDYWLCWREFLRNYDKKPERGMQTE